MTIPTYKAGQQQDGSWAIIRTEPYFMRLEEKWGSAVQRTYYKLGLTEHGAKAIVDSGIANDEGKLV